MVRSSQKVDMTASLFAQNLITSKLGNKTTLWTRDRGKSGQSSPQFIDSDDSGNSGDDSGFGFQ
jgi:hypothetical protein